MKDLQTWSDLNRGVRKTTEEPRKNHWYEMYKLECLKTKKLQEENAELKEIIDNDVDKKIYVQLAKKASLADVHKDQLTKAKDYILKLTTYLEGHTNYDFEYELIKEVKQFISEVEK